MIVIVCGGRMFGRARGLFSNSVSHEERQAEMKRVIRQRSLLFAALDVIHEMHTITRVVHGDALGADALAGEWARAHNVEETPFPADWDKYPKTAGPIRNREMAAWVASLPGEKKVVAFPGGSGTADMIKVAKDLGFEVMEVKEL